ncbi:MAG: tRNA (adenosine(37)-N6)-threonylcarbamoyltransferase complex dimerization subunit type 1 TsaB [Microlunatus sp.]|nr:tRNA (adenosine(37)-N6)-threonylcarbamoyltransferase complex dimerization subunit type 1 TsaB [Microlunatus sp.]MDN5803152.1 tRNA (adenosine(37)-N6)-threonylcarbamoyltransferase complex dimerization subunit type 1 TsaB [Microlunatus sp.]
MAESAVGRTIVLGLDTATVVCVGLALDGQVATTAVVEDRMAHVEQLIPMIRQVCADARVAPATLTDVIVGLGPGPYTGLRVGIMTARVLAEVAGAGLHGVCTLDAIAAQYVAEIPTGEFLVATDARRREVYWARYAADGTRLAGPLVDRPDQLPRLPTVGPATIGYPDDLVVVDGPRALDPASLVVAGPKLPFAGVEPLYLRRPDATELGRRKSVLARGLRRR